MKKNKKENKDGNKENKQNKRNKRNFKFLRNILISVVCLLIVANILNLAPGYRRDRYKDVTNIIVNSENLTEELRYPIYINENGTIYLSMYDIGNLFETTIYYEEKYETVVTIKETKVGSMNKNDKVLTVNGSAINVLDTIIEMNNTIYIPISEMKLVYNIDIDYSKENNRVVIDRLDKAMTKADVIKNTIIKYKSRSLSKDVATISQGEEVSCFYTTRKGWTSIRTNSGLLGYIRKEDLSNQYVVREDMDQKVTTKDISLTSNKFSILENGEMTDISIENVFNLSPEGLLEVSEREDTKEKIWAIVSNENFEAISKKALEDYKTRTEIINIIVNLAIKNKVSGIAIKTNKIEDYNTFKKFMFELSPRLREIGIASAVYKTPEIKSNNFKNIVDYILIEEGK